MKKRGRPKGSTNRSTVIGKSTLEEYRFAQHRSHGSIGHSSGDDPERAKFIEAIRSKAWRTT